MEDSNIEFVKNASLTNKSFGHNKYQLKIQELEKQIEQFDEIIKIKDNDISLFKNNLKDLNYQIQEKNIKITNISVELKNKIIEISEITLKYNDLMIDNDNYIIKYNMEHTCLVHDKLELEQKIDDKNINIDEISLKYNELKFKYHDNLNLLEKRSSDIYKLNTLNTDYANQLGLYKDLNISKEKEIDIIKKELENTNNKAFTLKTLLNDKDIYLKHITKQYAYEKPTNNTVTSQNTDTDTDTDNIDINQSENKIFNSKSAAIKMTSKRGVTLSKR